MKKSWSSNIFGARFCRSLQKTFNPSKDLCYNGLKVCFGGIYMILEQQFTEHVGKMRAYQEALSLLYWDLRTGAPKKGVDLRSETIGTLSSELFALSTSDSFGELLSSLEAEKDGMDVVLRRSVEEARK